MIKRCSQPVDWSKLSKARNYYSKIGYKYIEVPWLVSRAAIEATITDKNFSIEIYDKENLIGSAEQGFVELILNGLLKPDSYCSISPCFRTETVYNNLYQPHFMKLELFKFIGTSINQLDEEELSEEIIIPLGLAISAKNFFNKFLIPNKKIAKIVPTREGWDINIDNIEIGSYGIREYNGLFWCYGTGIAEPRFSYVMGT